jgi:hypothetical protein
MRESLVYTLDDLLFKDVDLLCCFNGDLYELCKLEETMVRQSHWSHVF